MQGERQREFAEDYPPPTFLQVAMTYTFKGEGCSTLLSETAWGCGGEVEPELGWEQAAQGLPVPIAHGPLHRVQEELGGTSPMSLPSTGHKVTFSIYSAAPTHCLSPPGSELCRSRSPSSLLVPRAWHVRPAVNVHGRMAGGWVYSPLPCTASAPSPYTERWSGSVLSTRPGL